MAEEVFFGLDHIPSVDNIIHSLQICRGKRNLTQARVFHIHICNNGLDLDRVIGNQLVPLFADCGSLRQAQQIFSRLPHWNTRSFASLMHCCIDHGNNEQVFDLYHKMQDDCMCVNDYIFVVLLKACSKMHSLERGFNMHYEICKEGYEINPYIVNTLVNMYGHCGAVEEALDVFDCHGNHDVVAWNALISVYVDCGYAKEALRCLEMMELNGVMPDEVTFVCALKACCALGTIDKGKSLHIDILRGGFGGDISVCNTLVDMYAKCGQLSKAQDVFDTISCRDVVSWNVLIEGYVEHGLLKEALFSLEKMDDEGLSPNAITFVYMLKACSHLGWITKGQELHSRIIKHNLESYSFVGNSLVGMYAQCGMFIDACHIFYGLPIKDIVSWSSLIAGYASHGHHDKALDCMVRMQLDGLSPNVVPWSAIILGYAGEGEIEKALSLYMQMQEQGLLPNHVTFLSVFKACGEAAALNIGRKFHAQVIDNFYNGHHINESSIEVALIDMYGRCGSMDDAMTVFNTRPFKGLVGWNALVSGYARHGETTRALYLLQEMKKEGIHPDAVSFVSILSSCSHEGALGKGQDYFGAMTKVYCISPMIQHYTCLVDFLSRAGQLDEAMALLERFSLDSDIVTWTSVVGACQKTGDSVLGSQAFDYGVKTNENHS